MKGLLDDKRHSQVSKGRRPNQVRIDALAAGVGPTAFGKCTVLATQSRTALTDFTMGGRVSHEACSINPYVGCIHSCRYCFVPQTLHVQRNRWGNYVIAKQNLATVLRSEVRTREKRTVFISTATDPYQSAEADHRITQGCLAVLANEDWPIDVLTRSPLVTRDINILRRFSRARVGLSIPTLDDEARRAMEPAAPAIAARLKTLATLSDAGLTVYANYAPAYPATGGFTMDDVGDAFKDAGVQWVNTSAWKYQTGYLGNVWDRLHKTAWAPLARHVADAPAQAADRVALDRAMKRVGIPIRTGFFNEPFARETGAPAPTLHPIDGFGHAARHASPTAPV